MHDAASLTRLQTTLPKRKNGEREKERVTEKYLHRNRQGKGERDTAENSGGQHALVKGWVLQYCMANSIVNSFFIVHLKVIQFN